MNIKQLSKNPFSIALAVFVKTPGISPVKTRLAQTIGHQLAEEFHQLSAKAVEKNLINLQQNSPNLYQPYWAVAEKEGMSHGLWEKFPTLFQGEGSLGERLNHIYYHLLQKHSFVYLLGADSPQLNFIKILPNPFLDHFHIGRCTDGGFYLFGGATPIDRHLWLEVPYGETSTAQILCEKIQATFPHSTLTELPLSFDVDHFEDLNLLSQEFQQRILQHETLSPQQLHLYQWVQQVLFQKA